MENGSRGAVIRIYCEPGRSERHKAVLVLMDLACTDQLSVARPLTGFVISSIGAGIERRLVTKNAWLMGR